MAATDPGSTFPPLSSTTRVRQPLRFKPQFRQYIWGGRRLAEMLEKPIGEGDRWAESWEVVDRAEAQSVVDRGPLAGHTLRELLIAAPQEILGRHAAAGENRFPLLFKYLDCQRVLSIQVHPDDAYGSRMKPPDWERPRPGMSFTQNPAACCTRG